MFGVLSLQKHVDQGDLQISLFNRTSTLSFSPDWLGDLLFNGIAQQAARTDVATGIQTDGSWKINEHHTLRMGFLVEEEHATSATTSSVLPVDASGTPTTEVPISIVDNQNTAGGLYGMYVQDEWAADAGLTLNYGLRLDTVEEFTHESQLSPRLNLVWRPLDGTTIHVGYSRYFVPPPYESLSPTSVANSPAHRGTRGDPG